MRGQGWRDVRSIVLADRASLQVRRVAALHACRHRCTVRVWQGAAGEPRAMLAWAQQERTCVVCVVCVSER